MILRQIRDTNIAVLDILTVRVYFVPGVRMQNRICAGL